MLDVCNAWFTLALLDAAVNLKASWIRSMERHSFRSENIWEFVSPSLRGVPSVICSKVKTQ